MFPQTQKYLVGLNLVQRYSKLVCPSDTHIPQIPVIVLQVSYHYEYNRFFSAKQVSFAGIPIMIRLFSQCFFFSNCSLNQIACFHSEKKKGSSPLFLCFSSPNLLLFHLYYSAEV